MKKKTPQSNIDFLEHTASFSRNGPLMQLFMLDAIQKQAENIVKNEAQVLKEMEESFVHGPAWVDTAKEYLEKQKAFFNKAEL